jgi:hypothetical protein
VPHSPRGGGAAIAATRAWYSCLCRWRTVRNTNRCTVLCSVRRSRSRRFCGGCTGGAQTNGCRGTNRQKDDATSAGGGCTHRAHVHRD